VKIGKTEYKKKTMLAKGPVTVVKISVTTLTAPKYKEILLLVTSNEPNVRMTNENEAISHTYL
jgi:hypothetical protein